MTRCTTVDLVRLRTRDGVDLDGAFYGPAGVTDAAIVYLHGKGGNFYSGPGRFLPQRLEPLGVAHLAINMRFHDLAYTDYDAPASDVTARHPVGGGMWEEIGKGHLDVGAAVDWCRRQSFERVYLVGHSSGGFYAGEYTQHDPDIAGRIFLSPLQDNRWMLDTWYPDDALLEEALDRAHRLVEAGDGHLLLPLDDWYYAISAAALVERARQRQGVWEDGVGASSAPALFIWGSTESRHAEWQSLYAGFEGFPKDRHVLQGADHFFLGHEDTLAKVIADFVMRTTPDT